MKRSRILTVISCLVHVLCTGQAYFDNFYYTGSNNLLSCHAITRADSGFAFVNYIRDSITGRQDFGMIRLDKDGNEVVKKTSNIFNLDYFTYMQGMKHFIAATPCSYFLTTNTPNALGGYDVILNKINRNTLDTIKTVFYPGGVYGLSLNSFIKMNDNKYLLIGDKGTSTGGKPMILELDSNLTAISNTTINWYDDFYCFNATYNPDRKRILLSGKTATGQYPVTLVEVDTLGAVLNSKISASSFTTLISQCYYSHFDSTYVFVGGKVKTKYAGYDLHNMCITKYDKNLNMLWQKSYGDYSLLNGLADAVVLADGSIVASGSYGNLTTLPLMNADQNGAIFKVDKDGEFQWLHEYSHQGPGNYWEYFYGIDTTREGGYILCGNAMNLPHAKAWAVKTDSLGCVLPGCISSTVSIDSVVIPSVYIAPPPPVDTSSTVGIKKGTKDYDVSVFPNPVKDLLSIKTDLTEQLLLTLTDVYGRILMSRLIQSKTEVNTEQLPKGVYFLKIEHKNKIIYTSKILKE